VTQLGGGDHGWAAVDIETTGLNPVRDRIVEIGVVRLGPNTEPIDEWSTVVNPGDRAFGSQVHGLRKSDIADAPTFTDIRDDLLARLAGSVLVAHNAPFDVAFLQSETVRAGVAWGPIEGLCTMQLLKGMGLSKSRKLHQACVDLDVWAGREHVALDDARAVAAILAKVAPRLWTVDSPAPAPAWPRPSSVAATKARETDPPAPPAPSVGRHFRLPKDVAVSETAASTYFGLLDLVVEDGRVTASELQALSAFAAACGIDRGIARELHLAYLEEMARLAQADGIVAAAEREHLDRLTALLSAALPR
jgi:DNA polymerase-3 subunit epsilon